MFDQKNCMHTECNGVMSNYPHIKLIIDGVYNSLVACMAIYQLCSLLSTLDIVSPLLYSTKDQ